MDSAFIADNKGKIKGRFTVPSNIPAGAKLVQFFGDQLQPAKAGGLKKRL